MREYDDNGQQIPRQPAQRSDHLIQAFLGAAVRGVLHHGRLNIGRQGSQCEWLTLICNVCGGRRNIVGGATLLAWHWPSQSYCCCYELAVAMYRLVPLRKRGNQVPTCQIQAIQTHPPRSAASNWPLRGIWAPSALAVLLLLLHFAH